MEAREKLVENNINAKVVNISTIKPIDETSIIEEIKKQKNIYSVEEHNIIGGLGDSIAAVVATNNLNFKLTKIGLKDCFAKGYGTYSQIKEMNGLDANSIYNEIMKNIK